MAGSFIHREKLKGIFIQPVFLPPDYTKRKVIPKLHTFQMGRTHITTSFRCNEKKDKWQSVGTDIIRFIGVNSSLWGSLCKHLDDAMELIFPIGFSIISVTMYGKQVLQRQAGIYESYITRLVVSFFETNVKHL